jgi:spermidine synthase
MRRSGLYGLFFLSGLSALIYELVWQRLLNLVFGVSTLSVSVVLAAFMGGLALGGVLFGRYADRARHPLRLYAWLEAGIGLSGLLVPLGFAALLSVYTSLHGGLALGPWGGACLRFVMAALVLILPTTLIGGTVPVMGRLAVQRQAALPTTFSLLYAVNTLGGVIGAAVTGFWLLRLAGMQKTLWLAAGINLGVALGALLAESFSRSHLRARTESLERPPPRSQMRAARPWLTISLAAATGAISMAFEVSWSRVLGILTSNSAYGFALLLSVLLLGLGLGGLVQWGWSRRRGDGWARLALCQWLLAGLTLCSLPFFHTAPAWLDRWSDGGSATSVFAAELVLTATALLLPAMLMGMSLPLLVTAPLAGDSSGQSDRFGGWLGRVYAANTLGCLAGAFVAGFVVIPHLGIQTTFGLLILGCLAVGLAAWSQATYSPLLGRRLAPALVLLAAAIGWVFQPGAGFLKSVMVPSRQLLYYREGNNATVMVVQESDGVRSLLVDGQPVASTVATSVVDQKMLAHLPLLLHPAPQRALTVGFGSGGTSYSMSLDGIDVDCVEIEGAVASASGWFASENHGVLGRPHYRLIIDDARSWLRVAPVHYDVIATDCTNIQYRSNGDLYTVDYFRLLKDRLTPTGLGVAWVPANGIDERDLKTLLRSFREVFPHTSIWFMNSLPTDFLIVIGTPVELNLDLQRIRQRLLAQAVARDLATVGLSDPCRLVYTFLAAGEELDAYLGQGDLNTDDRPVLSYSTYGAAYRSTIAANLAQLLACRRDVARYVQNPDPPATMLRHYVVSNELVLGHLAHFAGADEAARRHYWKASQFLPEYGSVE